MMIYGIMVTRNEEHRYLEPVLRQFSELLDFIFCYDDSSDDRTMEIASKYAMVMPSEREDKPSPRLLHNEAEFRGEAKAVMALMASIAGIPIQPTDYVLILDADEFLATTKEQLESLMDGRSYSFKVAEVFDISGTTPYVRKDGYWDDIWQPRFYPWSMNGKFRDMKLGCGSIPETAFNNAVRVTEPTILHYGYAREEDRIAKYNRYVNQPGHSSSHVKSIMTAPILTRWEGEHLNVER